MVKALSQAQIDRLAESGRVKLAEQRGAVAAPTLRNTRLAINLDGDDTLEWRGREYAVPPVAWDRGVDLLELQTRLHAMTQAPDSTMQEFRAIMGSAVRLFPHLVRRPLRRIRPNPFRRASGQEVGHLLGFFSACQMKPPPVEHSVSRVAHRPPSTSRTA